MIWKISHKYRKIFQLYQNLKLVIKIRTIVLSSYHEMMRVKTTSLTTYPPTCHCYVGSTYHCLHESVARGTKRSMHIVCWSIWAFTTNSFLKKGTKITSWPFGSLKSRYPRSPNQTNRWYIREPFDGSRFPWSNQVVAALSLTTYLSYGLVCCVAMVRRSHLLFTFVRALLRCLDKRRGGRGDDTLEPSGDILTSLYSFASSSCSSSS